MTCDGVSRPVGMSNDAFLFLAYIDGTPAARDVNAARALTQSECAKSADFVAKSLYLSSPQTHAAQCQTFCSEMDAVRRAWGFDSDATRFESLLSASMEGDATPLGRRAEKTFAETLLALQTTQRTLCEARRRLRVVHQRRRAEQLECKQRVEQLERLAARRRATVEALQKRLRHTSGKTRASILDKLE